MTIEILYIKDCPGFPRTLESVKRIAARYHIEAHITPVEVTDPATAGFRGSPTVRIDGMDIEASAGVASCGLCCRTYTADSGLSNVPSDALLMAAMLPPEHGKTVPPAIAPLAAIVAALGSVACCLPFGIAGALGTVGISFYLESKRPWVIGAAVVFLAIALRQMLRQRRMSGRTSPTGAVLFALATALVIAMIAIPDRVALLLSGLG